MAGKGSCRGRAGALRPALAAVLMACLALEATAFAWSPQAATLLGSQRAVPLCRCAASIPGPRCACTCGRSRANQRAPPSARRAVANALAGACAVRFVVPAPRGRVRGGYAPLYAGVLPSSVSLPVPRN